MKVIASSRERLDEERIQVGLTRLLAAAYVWPPQSFGGAGVSQDTPLAASWAGIRTLRFADGPDEVHNRAIALIEYAKHAELPA